AGGFRRFCRRGFGVLSRKAAFEEDSSDPTRALPGEIFPKERLDCDEAFDLCRLFCCVFRSSRADVCLSTIAGTYASAAMARCRCTAADRARNLYDERKRPPGCR